MTLRHPALRSRLSSCSLAVVLFASYPLVAPAVAGATPTIATVAGGGPDGLPAASANLYNPLAVVADGAGGFFIVANEAHRIYRVDASGTLTILAGRDGWAGFRGDGGPAAAARMNFPSGAALDHLGNLFIADTFNHRIRRIDAVTGMIVTVAGNGTPGSGGDNGPATLARLNEPVGLALDGAGILYIADTVNSRIRRLDATTGIITTVAGTGVATGSIDGEGGDPRDDLGDGLSASSASLHGSLGVTFDGAGDLFIADTTNHRIRRVDAVTGIMSTVAGTGVLTWIIDGEGGDPTDDLGDGLPALTATLAYPGAVAVRGDGSLVIADTRNGRVRRVDAQTGTIATLAGNGGYIFAGDGGPATAASLKDPAWVAFDRDGGLLIADSGSNRIRRVDAAGDITTAAGNGFIFFSGSGVAATRAAIGGSGVALDAARNLYVADAVNARVRRVDAATGLITLVAGNGAQITLGDGGPAVSASLGDARGVALDAAGNVFIAQQSDCRIRRVDAATGIITTVAGRGIEGYGGDGGPATLATLNRPPGVAVDGAGNIFIPDQFNGRVRRVDAATGIITTVAGTGTYGFSGDGGYAANAMLGLPNAVALDGAGNLFISDPCSHRIRRVDALTGVITTVAGSGPGATPGDGCRTSSTGIGSPRGIGLDGSGNLFIADIGNSMILRVDALTGAMTTVAGNGLREFSGDGGPATGAALLNPTGVSVDGAGNLFIADTGNRRVRLASAGNGQPVVRAGPDARHECSSPAGASTPLDGSESSDPDSSPGTNDDIVRYDWIENSGLPSQTVLGQDASLDVTLPLGRHVVTLQGTDRAGARGTDVVEIVIEDTTPPQMSLALSPPVLWPPNHRMVAVSAAVTAVDACGPAAAIFQSVESDEPDDAPGMGDGHTLDDIEGPEPGVLDPAFRIRAERDGNGDGRSYRVSYTAVDGSGNSTGAAASILVPVNHGPGAEPVQVSVADGAAGTIIEWPGVPGALHYDVVRGNVKSLRAIGSSIDLGAVTCVVADSTAPTTAGHEDPNHPASGEAFFYLVAYEDSWGSSSYATESAGRPGVVASGDCP